MYDPDVVAYLFPAKAPHDQRALFAINRTVNNSRCCKPGTDAHPRSTIQTESIARTVKYPANDADLEKLSCLVLRFSDIRTSERGFILGWGTKADLKMPKDLGVDQYHLLLTFDEQNELVVRAKQLSQGIEVIYNGRQAEPGSCLKWSVREPGLVKGSIAVLKVTEDIRFRIVIPDHDTTSQEYAHNVRCFLEGSKMNQQRNHALGASKLASQKKTAIMSYGEAFASPARPVGKTKPTFWKRPLGGGAFGEVHYMWDVTTRAEYAVKRPKIAKLNKQQMEEWVNEAETIKDVYHIFETQSDTEALFNQKNIVKLHYWTYDGSITELFLEFVPGGDLANPRYVSPTPSQTRQVDIQLLAALAWMHEKNPTGHRDVKPGNVFVQSWFPDKVHVKLADFGLSKRADDLRTKYKGTETYMAPEMKNSRRRYGVKIDIWSLAVLLVRLECPDLAIEEFPLERSGANVLIESVRRRLKDQGSNDVLSFILDHMLIVDPAKRKRASECHGLALRSFSNETNINAHGEGVNVQQGSSASASNAPSSTHAGLSSSGFAVSIENFTANKSTGGNTGSGVVGLLESPECPQRASGINVKHTINDPTASASSSKRKWSEDDCSGSGFDSAGSDGGSKRRKM